MKLKVQQNPVDSHDQLWYVILLWLLLKVRTQQQEILRKHPIKEQKDLNEFTNKSKE